MANKKEIEHNFKFNFILFLIALGIFTIILAIVYTVDMQLVEKYTLSSLKEKNISEVENYSIRLSNELNKNILIVHNLQTILKNYQQIIEKRRRQYYYNFLYNVLWTNTQIKSIFTIWKPYSIDQYDYKYKNLLQGYTGQFAVWLDREKINDSIPVTSEEINLLTTYENMLQNYNSDLLILSPIRQTYITEKSQYVVRIVGAIKDKKFNILGIVGIDIPIKYFSYLLPLSSLKDIIIVNDNFEILQAPNKQFIGKNIKSYNAKIFNTHIYSTLLKNQAFFSQINDPDKKNILFIAYPIKYPNHFWILIKFIPKTEYLEIKHHYTSIITISSFAIFLLFVILLGGFFSIYRKMIHFQQQLISHLYNNQPINLNTLKNFKIPYKEYKSFTSLIVQIQEKYKEKIEFIKNLNEGKYDIADIEPTSKFDTMATALNELKANLKKSMQIQEEYRRQQEIENWRNTGLAKFNEILRTYINDLETLTYETISKLTDYLDAQVGAFFVLTEKDEKQILELFGYYGYNRKIYEKKYFELGDGLTGNVALEKKSIVTIVPDNYVELATGLGKAKPNYIAVYPLLTHDILYGVIEIAKTKEFQDYQLKFLDDISQIIASSLATVKINQETKELLEQSQAATKQMQDKEVELEKTINKLEKIQTQSQEQQLKLESIISALNEIVYYIEFTKSQKVISINKQVEENFNITYTEAVEKKFFDLFNIHVTQIEKYEEIWKKVLNGHKEDFTLKIELEDKTIWIKASLIPIIKELKIDKILFIGIDITPVKEKEDELEKFIIEAKEKEEKLQVQEMEMNITFQELEKNRIKLEEKEKYIKKLEKELSELKQKHQGMMKEFEKRLSHSRKLETALKEKINHMRQEIKELKEKLKGK